MEIRYASALVDQRLALSPRATTVAGNEMPAHSVILTCSILDPKAGYDNF